MAEVGHGKFLLEQGEDQSFYLREVGRICQASHALGMKWGSRGETPCVSVRLLLGLGNSNVYERMNSG